MSFFDQLQQASFRGVPFGVLTAGGDFGRRVAVHEYPFRDKPWIEDLGRATRRISFVGFLIENSLIYGGGDVIGQREAMIAACETMGSGTLIHPTLGRLTVSCPEGGLHVEERWDEGRYFELGFTFIESGERSFPAASNDTGAASSTSADQSDLATAIDFVTTATVDLAKGEAIVRQFVFNATAYAETVSRLGGDATSLFTMIATLPGDFGRYFGGGTKGFQSQLPVPAGAPTTISGLVAEGSANRAAITAANEALLAAAAAGEAQTAATAAQGVVAALLAAMADPSVALRVLAELQDFYPDSQTTDSVIGNAMASMQTAFGALGRRAALAALVRASALYQPASRDAAAAVRDNLTGLLDDEIIVAGDNGDDNSYSALRDMRVAMVIDLNTRGAGLPPMRVFDFSASQPALTLAQRLYQDATRNDELISEANPPHPAFMPLEFSALSS